MRIFDRNKLTVENAVTVFCGALVFKFGTESYDSIVRMLIKAFNLVVSNIPL